MGDTSQDTFVVPEGDRKWWKEATIFQIWPHSFCDSNGDGVGDMPGITSKVGYLKDLGVDVIWLSPCYPSPFKDHGYDISNFCDINPLYGTLADWEKLRDEAAKHGMKVIMDLVLNHASDEHPWFKSARASKDSPYRDWFIWTEGEPGEGNEPNNFKSVFGGSAWSWTPETKSYYFHMYDISQPDLNWENPEVRAAMFKVVKFWLDKGCNGFRLDAIARLAKPPGMEDAPVTNPDSRYQEAASVIRHLPRLKDYLRELYDTVLQHHDLMTVGEMSGTTVDKALEYIGPGTKMLNMLFQFELIQTDSEPGYQLKHRKWTLPEFKTIVNRWQTTMYQKGGWNSNYLANHDQGRPVSKWGNDSPEFRARSAKLLATMECTLTGTLAMYQGEELAMKNYPDDFTVADLVDVQSFNYYNETKKFRQSKGDADPDMSDIMKDLQIKARDNGRMPVPWDSTLPNAGFSEGTPWMKVNKDDLPYAAAQQEKDPKSVLNYWKSAIKLRKANPAFIYGEFKMLVPDDLAFFAYTISDKYLVVMNWSNDTQTWKETDVSKAKLLLSNEDGEKTADFMPWEARVYSL